MEPPNFHFKEYHGHAWSNDDAMNSYPRNNTYIINNSLATKPNPTVTDLSSTKAVLIGKYR